MTVYMTGPIVVCYLLASFHGCYTEFLQAAWENTGTTNSKHNNNNAASCAANYMGTEHVGVRVKSDGRTTTCESLPFDWLTTRTVSKGYLYMYKSWSKVNMDPPLILRKYNTDNYKMLLPGLFNEGSSVTFTFMSDNKGFRLYDKSGRSLFDIFVDASDEARQSARMKFNGKYKNEKGDFPFCVKNVCELTLYGGRNYLDINTNASNVQGYTFNLAYSMHTTEVRETVVKAFRQDVDIRLFSVEFKGT